MIISELIAIVVCQLQLQVWPLMTRDTDCKLYLSPLLPLTAILSVFNFALICYWVPEDRHHLVHAQGLHGGAEAGVGHPEGAELEGCV